MGLRWMLVSFFQFMVLTSYGFQATNASRISILTAEGGDQIYNTFGHTAIRLWDTSQNIDIVYNYGTFDFGAPNFILNFVNGKLDYYLSQEGTDNYILNYVYQNRSLHQQILALDTPQINRLVNFLEWNMQPQNRVYRYDFLFDNCATRVRDIFEKMGLGIQINFVIPKDNRSFRKLIHHYAYKQLPWLDWGMDLLLGLQCDRPITDREYTFLPDYIHSMFAVSKNQLLGNLVAEENTLFTAKPAAVQSAGLTPLSFNILILLVGLAITLMEYLNKISIFKWDLFWMNILGLLGLVMFYVWFFTEHTVPKYNANMVWANPLYFVVMFCWLNKSTQPIFKKLCFFLTVLMGLFLLFGYYGLQPYHAATIPLVLLLMVRLTWISRRVEPTENPAQGSL